MPPRPPLTKKKLYTGTTIFSSKGLPEDAEQRYNPAAMKEGWNTMPDREAVFNISTSSAGLWTTEARLNNPARRDLSRS